MVEYLVEMLQGRFKTATLSRGYKRKTKGFALADEKTTAIDIGDEPMQFHQKFPEITVAVGGGATGSHPPNTAFKAGN